MTDYKDMGVNNLFQPTNSPVTSLTAISAYDFQSNNERNAVTSAFLGTFSADKITAGTIDASLITLLNLVVSASDLSGGTISTDINLGTGSGYIKIIGSANRIVVNDGTVDRVWLGNIG